MCFGIKIIIRTFQVSTRSIAILFPDCIPFYNIFLRSLINLRAQHDVNTGIHSAVAVKKKKTVLILLFFPLLNVLLITSKINRNEKVYFCSLPAKHSNTSRQNGKKISKKNCECVK